MRTLIVALLVLMTQTTVFAAGAPATVVAVVLEDGRYRTEWSICDRIAVNHEETIIFEFADSDRADCSDAGVISTFTRQADGSYYAPADRSGYAESITLLNSHTFKLTWLDKNNQAVKTILFRKIAD